MKSIAIVVVATASLLSQSAFALDVKPGLWKMAMKMKSNGKEMDPSAQIKAAMAKMPEAQRKQMMVMMGKMHAGISEDGDIQVCYSKEMLAQNKFAMGKNVKTDCDTKIVTNTPKKVETEFTCKDGSKGKATFTTKNPQSYQGVLNMDSPKHGKSEINYSGTFVNADCGTVKPLGQ